MTWSIFKKFIYFYSVTIVCIFSPSLHPTPASPTSLLYLYPPPWFCPCVLYSNSYRLGQFLPAQYSLCNQHSAQGLLVIHPTWYSGSPCHSMHSVFSYIISLIVSSRRFLRFLFLECVSWMLNFLDWSSGPLTFSLTFSVVYFINEL